MTIEEIEKRIEDLKADYTRLSADLEKVVFVKGNGEKTEQVLQAIVEEIAELRKQLQGLKNR